MVNVTKGKNVVVETYDAEQIQHTGNGTRTKFGVPGTGVETDVKYTRVYVDNSEVTPSSIAPGASAAITGNVTFTNGSATMSGTTLDTQVAPGNQIKLDADAAWVEVKTVDSATQITLTTAYAGAGGAAGAGSLRGGQVTLASAPAAGADIILYVPTTKNGAFSVQQDIKADIKTRTEDIKELGNDAVTRDVVEKVGTLALTFAQANNHILMNKLAENSKNDTFMVIAVKYKNTSPASYRIYKEARVADLGSGVAAGGIATETVTLNWVPPIEIKTA
jgi:hypothetical protein